MQVILINGHKKLNRLSIQINSMPIRSATHAGSWYSADKRKLATELDEWLDGVPAAIPCIRSGRAKADESVHAGVDTSTNTGEGHNSSISSAGKVKDVPVEGARVIIAP